MSSEIPPKSSSVIWRENGGEPRVTERKNLKCKPLDPARYFGSNPETEKTDSVPQAWWCPETDTPQAGQPVFEGLMGMTAMVDLSCLVKSRLPKGQVRVVAKCEYLSPGMSVHDREVKLKIDRAESNGLFQQGMTFVSSKCGDYGVSLAMMCAIREFSLVICVGDQESPERIDALKAYGVRLVVGGDLDPSQEAARLCEQNPKMFFNLDTFMVDCDDAAFLTLGPSIWDQTNGSITHWVCNAGTSYSGVSRFLAMQAPEIKSFCTLPKEQVFQGLCGISGNHPPGSSLVEVGDQECLEASLTLCREEGIMAGAISGLNVCAALQVAQQVTQPSLIVTILPDIGIKFLSTIFNEDWVISRGLHMPAMQPVPGCLDLECPGCSKGRVCPRAPEDPLCSHPTKGYKPRVRGSTNGERHYKRYEELIGKTPIIDLSHLVDQSMCHVPDQVKVLAKCEFFNPGFSLKDRIARNILDRAETAGTLKPGMCVVAASSGNTGAATAMLCAMRGYPCVITTCPKCSKEKQDAIKAYGAHLFVTKSGLSEESPDHYMNVARRLCSQNPGLFYDVDQYDTLANPEGHYLTLAPEIYQQTQEEVTHFICSGSTGGTVSGVGKFLKEQNPNIKVVLADPVGSVFTNYFLSGNVGKAGKYLVEGVGKGSIPGAMDFSIVDAILPVTDADAFATCSRLCREEGIWPGGSSGLNVYAALRLAETVQEPSTIVTVMPDLGLKYLTKIYNDEWLKANKLAAQPPVHVDGLAPNCF